MPAIIEFPTVVQDLVTQYADLFANEPERQHFAEYLTGLFIAERKTVSGINREFAVTTDQSCLNRWITEVEWDEKALNQRRLELLQREPGACRTSGTYGRVVRAQHTGVFALAKCDAAASGAEFVVARSHVHFAIAERVAQARAGDLRCMQPDVGRARA